MMFEIKVTGHFDAAHYLRGYQGKCESLHGHRYQVAVKIKSDKLDETGIAYDFTALKKHLEDVLKRFDHTCLNDVPPFDRLNPSSENIAMTIFDFLKEVPLGANVELVSVEVWETPDSSATYSPE